MQNVNLMLNDERLGSKTSNLTQSHAQNDPINCQIHGFSFRDFEDEVWRSGYDFF